MPGPGGGPSRRSHTKSRKGCKTCKRRHIRCDESFPQCKNCTKHQVRCDYKDSISAPNESLRHSITENLPWTPEIEHIVDSWRQHGQDPFPNLQIFPPLSVMNLPRNEVRLLYHVCSLTSTLTSSNTVKFGLWTNIMPKFLGLAANNSCVMQAVLSFSAAILAWETNNEDTRYLSTSYSVQAHASLPDTSDNSDALFAALTLLSWVETTWDRWTKLNKTLTMLLANIQTFRADSLLANFASQQTIDFTDHLEENKSRFLSEEEVETSPDAYREIQAAMAQLHTYLLQPEFEHGWFQHLTSYMSTIMMAKRAITPKEQFNYLYHLRKLLFWVPTSLMSARSGDIQSLLVLSHIYASALKLEEVFPDIGVSYIGNFVLEPLQEALRVLQIYQSNPSYASMAQTTTILTEFPTTVVSDYVARRQWMSRQSTSSSLVGAPTIHAPYDIGHITSQFAYTPSLSPSFAASHLASPGLIGAGAATIATSSTTSGTPRSPFLTIPGTPSVDSYGGTGFPNTSFAGNASIPYLTSPLSPALNMDNEYKVSISGDYPALITTSLEPDEDDIAYSQAYETFANMGITNGGGLGSEIGSGTHSPSHSLSHIHAHPSGMGTAGCVVPTAVWS